MTFESPLNHYFFRNLFRNLFKPLIGVFFMLFSAGCSTMGGKNPDQYGFKQDVSVVHKKLNNGLTVILVKNPKAPVASIYHWVRVGSLHEKPGTTGIAHLFEHMMFRPLEKGAASYKEKAGALGATHNANTRFGSTVYYVHVPHENLGKMLSIEADRLKKLKVTEELLKTEKEAVRSEYITKMDSNPVIDLWDRVYKAGFKNHPYGWMIVGFRKDLDLISADDCNEFFDKYYKPNNVGLVISGDIDVDQTMAWVKEHYSDWKPGVGTQIPSNFANKEGFIKAKGKLDSNARYVLAAYRTPDPMNYDHRVMDLVNYIFFDSGYSLANRQFEIENKLASSTSSFNYYYDRGAIKFFANLKKEVTMNQFLSNLAALNSMFSKMSEKEFETYKKQYQIELAESVLRNSELAENIAFGWGKYGDYRAMLEASKKVHRITREDIKAFVDRYFIKENLVVVTNKNFKD